MAERVFAMPDLGEGLEEGRIVEWLVHEGDVVALNQPLVEVETAKAAVEIPSPFAGTVATLHGRAGEDVAVGAPLVTFAVDGVAAVAPVRGSASLAAEAVTVAGEDRGPLGPDAPASSAPPRPGVVRAAPAVRRLAKDLGVDLAVGRAGPGPGGRITEDDVRGATSAGTIGERRGRWVGATGDRRGAHAAGGDPAGDDVPDRGLFGARGVPAGGARGSPLPVVIAALCRTIADHPILNARWRGGAVEDRTTIDVGDRGGHGAWAPRAGCAGCGSAGHQRDRG